MHSSNKILIILLSFVNEALPILVELMGIEVTEFGLLTLEIALGSVVTVLNFHTCVFAKVDIVAPRLFPCKVVLNTHVHIKCLISFLLAVFDALELLLSFWSHEVHINTILVALFEKNFWESMLLK